MAKMPSRRYRDTLLLSGFLKRTGPLIAEALEPKMVAVLKKGETLPDVAHLLEVLGRMVAAEQRNLEQKDTEQHLQKCEFAGARWDLQRVMPVLRSRVQEVRKWMNGHLDPETIQHVVGFKGRTPRSREGIVDLAELMVKRLPALRPVETPAGPFDPAGWAEYLSGPLDRASNLLAELEGHSENRSISAQKKSETMRTFDKLFRRVARLGWIICHLGGVEKTARQLVFKVGRPGVKTKKLEVPSTVA